MRFTSASIAIAIVGCFSEPGVAGEDEDEDDPSTGTTDTTAEGSGTSAGPASGSGSQSGATASVTTADPSTVTSASSVTSDDASSEVTGTECGTLGAGCCGDACDEGACWHDRCVAFAGMYAEPFTCMGCTADSNGKGGIIPPSVIPYLGACACPDGFETSPPVPTTSDYCPVDGLLHTSTSLRACQSETLSAHSDWLGMYATSANAACQTGSGDCIAPNPYTGNCDCPNTVTELIAETFASCLGDGMGDHAVEIHVCINPDVEPVSFGGAYQTRWDVDAPPLCVGGNPLRNEQCECPEGFVPEGLRITSPIFDQGGDLFVCVRY